MRNVLLRFLIGISPLMLLSFPLFAQDKKPVPPSAGMGGLMPMLLFMFLIIYFLMIRPEQRKNKERKKLLSNLKKGDKVLTASGMYGTVGNVKEATVMIRIADNTVVEFAKSAVASVVGGAGGDSQDKTPAKA
jgi:preprotein translocase subunit YajC